MHSVGEIRTIVENSGFAEQYPVPVDEIIKQQGYSFHGVDADKAPHNFSGMVDHEEGAATVRS